MEIRRGLFVTWKGRDYPATPDRKRHFLLYSSDPNDSVRGFMPSGPTEWCLRVRSEEVDAAFIAKQHAHFMGHVFVVVQAQNGEVCLGTGDRPPDDLKFEKVEPGAYEKWVPATQVETWEEKVPFQLND